MHKYILSNGIKVIYEHREGSLSSFCIGFEAGALMEDGFKLGTAHAVEHMLFKGTNKRSEYEINKLCDEIFGFNNAMTNFPYCIYYGTTLSSDFEKGFEVYSDIILNPTFREEGFKEEISVICEELKEWNDDIEQYCEDELLYNSFAKRRIKNLIIGTDESVRSITLEDIKSFYNRYYTPENCIISVVSSLSFDNVLKVVEDNFRDFNKIYMKPKLNLYENNLTGVFIEERNGISGAKLQWLYPIHELNDRELSMLRIFNNIFGEGTSGLLYDEVRTKQGLVYDIGSTIKNEKGIKLFVIHLATSESNITEVMRLIEDTIERVKNNDKYFTEELIKKSIKSIKLKSELGIEKSIELCKKLTTYELMYKDCEKIYKENNFFQIDNKEIIDVIYKVFSRPSIQIIKPA